MFVRGRVGRGFCARQGHLNRPGDGRSGRTVGRFSRSRLSVSRDGLIRAAPHAARDLAYVLIVVATVAWAVLFVLWGLAHDLIGFDLRGTLWDPAVAIREGRSPFPAAIQSQVDVNNPALYPPLFPMLLIPISFLPWSVGMPLWIGLLIGGSALTLYALNVRDLRCYAIAISSAGVIGGLVFGNLTLLLVPLVALAWRWRDNWLRSGVLIGLAIAGKLFFWPLLFWLLGTRRYRAAAAAVATMTAGLLVPWALIGFDGLAQYPDLLRMASEIYGTRSYSVTTMLSALDASLAHATHSAPFVGLVLGLVAFMAGRRRSDELSLSIAILAAILASPIVWDFNFTLLLIPVAIVWPRFAPPWILLPLIYFTYLLPRPPLARVELAPGGSACCRPETVPEALWNISHAPPALWPALGHVALATAVILLVARTESMEAGVRTDRAGAAHV